MRTWISRLRHLVGAALAIIVLPAAAAAQAGPEPGGASFQIVLRGAQIGREDVRLERTADGWTIASGGRQSAPSDLVISKFELQYTADWQAKSLAVEATVRGQLLILNTKLTATTATSDILQGGVPRTATQTVSPRAVVLPNNFYAGYEALAARLASAAVGTTLPIYVAPQGEITAVVDSVTPVRLSTISGPVELRQFDLTFKNPQVPLLVHVWIDARNRLARIEIPAASITVVRDDLGGVMTRFERSRNPGDESAFIPANGFNLAATTTKPAGAAEPMPAVVLIGGSGPSDRDEVVYGIPIFGQVAGALSRAGVFVVRYDKRGIGQSGGRAETATLQDYADDVHAVVQWLKRRKDIDGKRIALLGHSEGGAVALIVAKKDGGIAAVALLAAPGMTGREITLAQQKHALDRSAEPEASRQAKVALELKILDAVVTGKGWEDVPAALRAGADVPWFKSWLTFDPAALVKDLDQPILIVQGSLDTQVPPVNADRLEMLGRARRNKRTDKIVVPGVNHLLVPATTGEVDEYASLPVKSVSPAVLDAVAAWLKEVLKK